MDQLVALDKSIGESCYVNAQQSYWRHAATIASLLVDEAAWFTIPLVLAAIHVIVGVLLPEFNDALFYGLPLAYFVDTFTDAVLVSTWAGLTKLCTMRERPAYAEQSKTYITNGDKYSFPSGHTLFAAFTACSFAGRPLTSWMCKAFALVGVAGIGWSRVAKGRHFPSDTIVGALIGALLAQIPLQGLTFTWAVCKFVVAVLDFCEIFLALVMPRFRTAGVMGGVFFLALVFALLPFGSEPPPAKITFPFSLALIVISPFFTPSSRGLLRGLNPSFVKFSKKT